MQELITLQDNTEYFNDYGLRIVVENGQLKVKKDNAVINIVNETMVLLIKIFLTEIEVLKGKLEMVNNAKRKSSI